MKNKKNPRTGQLKHLLRLLQKRSYPLSLKEIYKKLRVKKSERKQVEQLIKEMVAQGKLIHLQHEDSFMLRNKLTTRTGTLQIISPETAFVLSSGKDKKDVFISKSYLQDALHGDKVEVAVLPRSSGKNPEGIITRVLERRQDILPLVIHTKAKDGTLFAHPAFSRQEQKFLLNKEKWSQDLQPGDVLLAKPQNRLEGIHTAIAKEFLGKETHPGVQEEIVKLYYGIRREFPSKTMAELEKLPVQPEQEELSSRTDLRKLPFVTIDQAEAKDFDDAVFVQQKGKNMILYVAIADVSHYVKPGSELDKEARIRGNSFYFPQTVEPMFPPQLSNGICSLNPGEDKLVMLVEIHFSPQGKPGKSLFYPALINSWARLTYAQVHQILQKENDHANGLDPRIISMLQQAEQLAGTLLRNRIQRGALQFELPEAEFVFDASGSIENIRTRSRHFSHQIIEEFMIRANEAVAEHLQDKSIPCMYRVHAPPDQEKLQGLAKVLQKTSLGLQLSSLEEPGAIQRLLHIVQETDYRYLVHKLLLRSMMQAEYNPENYGHFGLASACYCHFTSPIRRYADLVVHRALKYSQGITSSLKLGFKDLHKLGRNISGQERIAQIAEREIGKRLGIIFLQDKIGQEFQGLVSSVSDFGLWVEMQEYMLEGLVSLSSLTDDYYLHWPEEQKLVGANTGKIYSLGQKIRVRLTAASLHRLEIDLEMA